MPDEEMPKPPVAPEDDIGPVYKGFAGILMLASFVIVGIHTSTGTGIGFYDVLFVGMAILFGLALWRPRAFDSVMKTIGDKLPIPFTKNE